MSKAGVSQPVWIKKRMAQRWTGMTDFLDLLQGYLAGSEQNAERFIICCGLRKNKNGLFLISEKQAVLFFEHKRCGGGHAAFISAQKAFPLVVSTVGYSGPSPGSIDPRS